MLAPMVSHSTMRRAVGGLLLALAPVSQAPAQTDVPRTADELYAAWLALPEGERRDTVEWFVAESDRAQDFRSTLERFMLDQHRANRFGWPEAPDAPPLYDTAKHCPAQLIPRKFVDTGNKRFAATVEKLVGGRRQRDRLDAFGYDWALGTVVTMGPWDAPERIAFNAARGLSPYTSLVEALVEQQLDAGEVRAEAAAFAHAYSDRSGNAYREITLYEAWSSGTEIEMPDVECLGMLHDLEDDWHSFTAPVPGRKQRPLYDRLGVHYAKLRKYRALRTALARTYLSADPVLPGGYGPSKLRLNGFWELQSSDPTKMAEDLPTVKGWGKWFEERAAQADDDPEVVARSRARMKSLAESQDWSRRTFQGILKEYGAFDPKPPAQPEPADGGAGEGETGGGGGA